MKIAIVWFSRIPQADSALAYLIPQTGIVSATIPRVENVRGKGVKNSLIFQSASYERFAWLCMQMMEALHDRFNANTVIEIDGVDLRFVAAFQERQIDEFKLAMTRAVADLKQTRNYKRPASRDFAKIRRDLEKFIAQETVKPDDLLLKRR